MLSLIQDVRLAARMLVKNPGFSSVAVITLALGIGANAAMFSVVNAVLLRALPFPEPDRLVAISTIDITRDNRVGPVSYPAFLDWRSQTQSIESMSAWRINDFALIGRDESVHVVGGVVSASFFSTLGVSPMMGRTFAEGEDQPGTLPVVLSHQLWQKQFGSDPNILGQPLTLDGLVFSIVGIMPPRFQFPIQLQPVELWTTISVDAQPNAQGEPITEQRGVSYLNVLGRLNPHTSIEQARVEMDRVQQVMNEAYPENRPRGIRMVSQADEVVGDMRRPLLFLFGAVAVVLLIACANVANLLLLRFSARQRELALRAALGASRATIARQLLVEAVLLSLLGGCLGLALTAFAPVVLRLAPSEFGHLESTVDSRVFWFTLLVAVATGLVFGMFPALKNPYGNLSEALNAGGRSGAGSVGAKRTRMAILFAQVTLTTVLLSGAGLLLLNLLRLVQTNPGFAADHVMTFALRLPSSYVGARRSEFYNRLLEQIRAIPGVRRASIVRGLPMGSTEHQVTSSFEIQGSPTASSERPTADLHMNDLDYFHTMGIPLISGRYFTERDDDKSPPVVIINQTMARSFFSGEDPIGKHMSLGVNLGRGNPTCEVVGIVGDVRSSKLGAEPVPEIYIPITQLPVATATVVVRTTVDPESVVPALRNQVRLLDREVPLREVETLEDYVSASIAVPRFSALLLGMFAVLSLVLTAVGLYGLISNSVVQRTREIGIRLALGAQRKDIIRMVVREVLVLVGTGAVVGLAGAVVLNRLVGRWLYLDEVGRGDAGIFLGVAVSMIVIAFCAGYAPTLRAIHVEPVVALRQE